MNPMWPGVRLKLVMLSVAVLVVVSFAFTTLSVRLTRGWVEEDFKTRAIAFAREIAVTIGDPRELRDSQSLRTQIREILAIRQNVAQLDILALGRNGVTIVATSHPERRLPFARPDMERARQGLVVSRLIERDHDRYWEVLAPITLDGETAGAVGAKFSLEAADRLAGRTRAWAFTFTAASVVVMAVLMSLAIRHVVDRPVRRLVEAISRVRAGDTGAQVRVASRDEFGVVAQHFNEMVARIARFNDELQFRVREAVGESDARYREVQQLNAQLFELGRRLSHAERLAVSGRIVAEVAHEVGTPLHSVAGHLELLRKELASARISDESARRLDVIEAQLARVTGIITQLLDITRRSAGPAARVDVNRLLRETIELVRPGVSAAGLALDVDTSPDLPPVHGHGSQLQQVFLNLLTNAIDATPAGGRVSVRSRLDADRGQVVVEVRDTGQGIDPQHRRQIFDPFFSTKAPGLGAGLGLFVSSEIVREHKGSIEVESAPDRGSAFRVCLPSAREAA